MPLDLCHDTPRHRLCGITTLSVCSCAYLSRLESPEEPRSITPYDYRTRTHLWRTENILL
ncbi:hypothetical protein SISSUDRAFT_1103571 [Sistotremastrum suecicum HHB10207 ss-3]|uniref:Uncharacterized protein n=1 Tax=Sistotremastrum suecicum HHB10207 ss-3 TaxID=1314776 RepID=A0A165WMR4_9AGAM|nr:hypothetical protein SISSUDRAFT_1103571 [Sistotremastrum suecicum HHB10207 ss-3]